MDKRTFVFNLSYHIGMPLNGLTRADPEGVQGVRTPPPSFSITLTVIINLS